MADQSVEDVVRAMDCDQLADMLKQVITDKKYQSDLMKLIDENIDGDLFLGLLEDKDLLADLKLTAGGKAKIRSIINKVKDGSFELTQAGGQKLLEPMTNGYSDKKKVERDQDQRNISPFAKGSALQTGVLNQDYGGITMSSGSRVPSGGRRIATDSGDVIAIDNPQPGRVNSVQSNGRKPNVTEEQSEAMDVHVEDFDDVDSTTTLSERDIRAVMREIGTLVVRYQQLGRELGVPAHELQMLQMQYGVNVSQAFNDMVLLWLRGRAPRTWQALVRAVADPLGGNDDALAKTIAARHKAGSVAMNMSQGPPVPPQDNGGGRGLYLTINDLQVVKRALWDARVKWHSIGLELGIPPGDLDAIDSRHRGAPDHCFRDMLTKFLQQAPPQKRTWSQLADVMASPMVGRGDIAEQLRMHY